MPILWPVPNAPWPAAAAWLWAWVPTLSWGSGSPPPTSWWSSTMRSVGLGHLLLLMPQGRTSGHPCWYPLFTFVPCPYQSRGQGAEGGAGLCCGCSKCSGDTPVHSLPCAHSPVFTDRPRLCVSLQRSEGQRSQFSALQEGEGQGHTWLLPLKVFLCDPGLAPSPL